MIDLTDEDRLVYRELLKTPGTETATLAERTGLGVVNATKILERLTDAELVSDEGGLHAVPPQLGFARQVGETERLLHVEQARADAAREHLAGLAAEYAELRSHEAVVELTSLDAVQTRLNDLSESAEASCLSFVPQHVVPTSEQSDSEPLNAKALSRGVIIRSIYPDSLRNDFNTLRYARSHAESGGELRTVPVVPMQMIIVDKKAALLPIDPANPELGALEVHSPGILLALDQLFQASWTIAVPLDSAAPRDIHGLTPQEAQVMQLLAEGYTDEMAARRLRISVRTVRRVIAELTERLEARSRFEAGAKAAARGWI